MAAFWLVVVSSQLRGVRIVQFRRMSYGDTIDQIRMHVDQYVILLALRNSLASRHSSGGARLEVSSFL